MMKQGFKDAKLGIFIHYGIYSVNGTSESGAMYGNECTPEEYYSQLGGFKAENLNLDDGAKIIKSSGARYSVLTAKHHDGVCLGNSESSKLNIFEKTPIKLNIAEEFVKSMRKQNIEPGLYFSLLDGSHPDYPTVFHPYPEKFPKTGGLDRTGNMNFPEVGKEDYARGNNFLEFNNKQLAELSKFNPSLFGFDGDGTRSPEQGKSNETYQMLQNLNPDVVMNSRFNREKGYGDYDNPEQDIPLSMPDRPGELCLTMNQSGGFKPQDGNGKSFEQIIKTFIEVISMGGNLLLNVGPKSDGTFPKEAINLLEKIGEFTKKYSDAIFGTQAGLPLVNARVHSTLSKDKKKLFLFQFGSDNIILIKGISSKPARAFEVGSEISVDMESNISNDHPYGFIGLNIKNIPQEGYVRVVCVEFETEIKYETFTQLGAIV